MLLNYLLRVIMTKTIINEQRKIFLMNINLIIKFHL